MGRNKFGKNNPMYGKHHSKETKNKQRLAGIGHSVSEEIRVKIGLSVSKNAKVNPNSGMKGKHHSKESNEKNRLSSLNKKQSEETKKKISESRKGLKRPPFSEEWKRKISNALKGRVFSQRHKDKIREKRKNWVTPTKDTSIEVKLQNFLKQLNIEFFTHQYIHIEHGYQCDIFIPSKNLVIECDGNYWHSYPTGREIDHIRTKELLERGFRVLRLWEFEINKLSLEEFKKRL